MTRPSWSKERSAISANVSTRYSGITELSTDWGVDDKGEPITLTDAYGGPASAE